MQFRDHLQQKGIGFVKFASSKSILLTLSILVIYLRAPSLFQEPRFWAEEGTIYFSNAYHLPWHQSLVHNSIGYINLWPTVAAAFAAHCFDLRTAPFVTTLFALFAQILPILVILSSRSKLWSTSLSRFLGVVIILFIPLSHESWLNTVNSQFYLQLACFLILLDVAPDRVWHKWFYRISLFFGGLTGFTSLFLTPLFLVSSLREKQKERWAHFFILVACGLLQAISIVVMTGSEVLSRRFNIVVGIRTTISILWTRTIGLALTGVKLDSFLIRYLYPITESSILKIITPVLLLSLEMGFFWLLMRRLEKSQRYLWAGGFLLTFFPSVLFAVGSKPKYFLIFPEYSPRYFIVPTAIFILMILQNFMLAQNARKILFSLLLSVTIFWGVLSFATIHPNNAAYPIWSQEVDAWQADPTYRLNIWPSGWSISLQPPQNESR